MINRKSNGLWALMFLALAPLGFAQDLVVEPVSGMRPDFIRGVDVSMLGQMEEVGAVWYDHEGRPRDLLELMREQGVNWIRLRLWNDPVNHAPVVEGGKIISNRGQRAGGGNNDLKRTIEIAARAKKLGLKVLLDFHYSDFWTDPGKQAKPEAWKNLTGRALERALENYTRDVLLAMRRGQAWPDMVQIGNELNNGLLWPDGKIWASPGETVGGFSGFVSLMKAARRGVDRADPRGTIKVAVHLANGGDNGLYRSVFDPLVRGGLDFDIIGLSYYNYWHGSLADLRANLADLSSRYQKNLVIMETAYAWTEDDADPQGNVFQVYNGPDNGYRASPQGQATAVRDVFEAVAASPDGRGLGAFYWEPGWYAVAGAGWRTGEGNGWDNQAMFDAQGRALPSLRVFGLLERGSGGPVRAATAEPVDLVVARGDPLNLPPRVRVFGTDHQWRWAPVSWESGAAGVAGDAAATPRAGTGGGATAGAATTGGASTAGASSGGASGTDTSILEIRGTIAGTGLPALARVRITAWKNLLDDPSFESGAIRGWTLDDPLGASRVENNATNAHSGSWTFKYWLDKPFTVTLSRTFTGITDGTYTFRITSMGGGGERSMGIFARTPSRPESHESPVVHQGWKQWVTTTLTGIEVRGGQATIGIRIDGSAGNWGNFDDAEFYREP